MMLAQRAWFSTPRPRRSLLPRQLCSERPLPLGHVPLIALRIDECCPLTALQACVLPLEVEKAAMRAQEYVGRQGLQDAKRALVISRDLRIARVLHEAVTRIHIGTADNHDMVR